MRTVVGNLGKLPSNCSFYFIRENGDVMEQTASDSAVWRALNPCEVVELKIRLLGGKGGFGSLLRSFGNSICKSTSTDSSRDLSGRRLGDVKEEERLKKWIQGAAERDREKAKKKREKLERLAKSGADSKKHFFEDKVYFEEKDEIADKVESAVEQGLGKRDGKDVLELETKAVLDFSQPGPSGSRKRAAESLNGATSVDSKKKKRGVNLWIGVDLDVSSGSDSEDESSDLKEIVKDEAPVAMVIEPDKSTDKGKGLVNVDLDVRKKRSTKICD